MATLEKKLAKLEAEKKKIASQIIETRKRKKIKCAACKSYHAIGQLDAIQTHDYVPPEGCAGGDYGVQGEMRFICPKTQRMSRLLFFNDDVPYKERDRYENDPEKQFKDLYGDLFRSVKEIHERHGEQSGRWVNNDYVDEHRREFGLVEKRAEEK